MTKKLFLYLISFIFSQFAVAQRNVILIIVDDLGSDYCGFYENHLDTCKLPNVRKLLGKGVRFTQAWSNPLCSPTRAGILTGRYSFRHGVGDAVGGAGSAELDTSELTIPRLLQQYKPNGIAKANIGKWHLNSPSPISNYKIPNALGYDHYEGNFLGVLTSFFDWKKVTNGVVSTNTNYATTETVNNAVTWVKSIPSSKPFFLWLAFNAPHTPYHLPPQHLHSYNTLSGTASDIAANPKSYFKAMVEALDTEIGRLFDSLQVTQRLDSTDIIFIGDNGDDPMVAQNTGGAKGSVNQEGISIPFIISGPSVVKPNRVSDALVNSHDLFATILEIFEYNNWQSQISSAKPVDSKSLMPILKNTASTIRPWIFSEVFRNPANANDGKTMRNIVYKLIDYDNGTQKFFDLGNDPQENTNLLLKTLSATELTNYNYLCNEMTKLTGTGGFCLQTDVKNTSSSTKEIFPNPFSSHLQLKSKIANEKFELRNYCGQIIYYGNNIESQNFSALASGIYFLKIIDETTTIIKLVKE